jgi:hypothetical protein
VLRDEGGSVKEKRDKGSGGVWFRPKVGVKMEV